MAKVLPDSLAIRDAGRLLSDCCQLQQCRSSNSTFAVQPAVTTMPSRKRTTSFLAMVEKPDPLMVSVSPASGPDVGETGVTEQEAEPRRRCSHPPGCSQCSPPRRKNGARCHCLEHSHRCSFQAGPIGQRQEFGGTGIEGCRCFAPRHSWVSRRSRSSPRHLRF